MLEAAPIIVHFPAYAGGKFISNCLSYSNMCMLCDEKSINDTLLPAKVKHLRILNTLPSPKDMENWLNFEFGEVTKVCSISKLLANNRYFFITVHNLINTQYWVNVFGSKCNVISIVNARKFQKIAASLKDPGGRRPVDFGNECEEKYNYLKGPDWPDWEEFENFGYQSGISEIQEFYPVLKVTKHLIFNLDSVIFDRTKFLIHIEELYKQLKLTDFNKVKCYIDDYYQQYIKLHRK